MSKLDEIIDEAGNVMASYSCYTSAERPEIKRKIKSLMLELIGEVFKGTESNTLVARQRVDELSQKVQEL